MSILLAFFGVVAGLLMILAPALFIGPWSREEDPASWNGRRLRLAFCGGVLILIALGYYAYICTHPPKASKDKGDKEDSAAAHVRENSPPIKQRNFSAA